MTHGSRRMRLTRPGVWPQLCGSARFEANGLVGALAANGEMSRPTRLGSVCQHHCRPAPDWRYADILAADATS